MPLIANYLRRVMSPLPLALQTTVSPRSLLLMHAPVSPQQQQQQHHHHSHRVAMETAERRTPRVRDRERGTTSDRVREAV